MDGQCIRAAEFTASLKFVVEVRKIRCLVCLKVLIRLRELIVKVMK
jgi:hypothetical protein